MRKYRKYNRCGKCGKKITEKISKRKFCLECGIKKKRKALKLINDIDDIDEEYNNTDKNLKK